MAKKGNTRINPGTAYGKDGKQLTSVEELLTAEAKCGCGIDCCKGQITLWDQETDERVAIMVVGGALVVTPI